MSFSEADSIPPYVEVPVPRVFRHGGISAPIAPGVLTRDQLVVLRIIRDSFPERPIYFTAREDATALGLSPYTLRQGLVHKLTPALATPGRDTVAVGGEVLDLLRSTALWDGVYRAPRALIREGEWVDRASISIPLLYLATGDLLARALAERGDRARARQLADTVERMVRAVHLAPASGGASGG